MKRPEIYEYHNYREFLKDWLSYLKKGRANLSLRQLAKSSEIAPSHISMVLNGKRDLTKDMLSKLKPYLQLRPSELSYLENLQVLSDSDSQEERVVAIKKMQKFSNYKQKNLEEVVSYKYLSKWHHVVIRELADLKEFSLDTDWIHKHLKYKVSKKDIRSAVQFLVDHEYIIESSEGRFILKEKNQTCFAQIHKSGLTEFHKQMFQLATQSIDKTESERRWISGETLAISQTQFDQVRKILQEAHSKISKLKNNQSDNDIVYHTSFIAFPVSEISNNGDEE